MIYYAKGALRGNIVQDSIQVGFGNYVTKNFNFISVFRTQDFGNKQADGLIGLSPKHPREDDEYQQ